jgi:phosphonate transport system substrate-binding protein
MKRLKTLLGIVACCLVFAAPARAAEQALVLAIHPYLPVREIHQRFDPLAHYLARAIGRPVTVRIGSNYEQHNQAVGKNQVDLALLGPVPYIHVTQRFGPKPLLARFEVGGQSQLHGVIAVRKDSKFKALAELGNASLAFGDADSTMSHIVPRYLLLEAGIARGAPPRHKFLGSHKNVALAVLSGDYDAGALKKDVFDEFEPRGLRALATTPGVPDHVLVARADLPAATLVMLRQALLNLKDQPGGQAVLNAIQSGLSAFGPVNDADFDALRSMVRKVDDAIR